MKHIMQILFLWLAGFSLLGHSLIPHHHHNSNNELCAHESNEGDHNHYSEYSGINHHNFTDSEYNETTNCCSDNSSDYEQVCRFQTNLVVEKKHAQFAASVICLLTFENKETKTVNYCLFKAKKSKDNFARYCSNKAPPALT